MIERSCVSAFLFLFFCCLSLPAQTEPTVPHKLTLGIAEDLLLQRNQSIASGRYQLDVSLALARIAGYKPNPVFHVGMEQAPVQSPVPGSAPRFFASNPDAGSNPVYTGQITKIIERGGKRELRAEQAGAVVDASRAQVLDVFRNQLFQLRQAFTNAILGRENVRLAQSIDAQYVQTEQLTKVRVDAGDAAAVELFRARAARLPYRQSVIDAQAAYEQAMRDILNLLNARPGGESFPIEIEGMFAARQATPPLEQLRRIALSERPDVVNARNTLRAAERGTELARAQRTRDITLGMEYQRVGEDHTLGMTAEFPVFAYNNQKAGIALAVAQEHAAQAQLRQVETQTVTDVEKAYQAWLSAQRSLAIYNEEGLAATARMRSITEFSYRRGEASLFELLDAQRTASQSAIAANQARAANALAIFQLEQAIGQPLP